MIFQDIWDYIIGIFCLSVFVCAYDACVRINLRNLNAFGYALGLINGNASRKGALYLMIQVLESSSRIARRRAKASARRIKDWCS